MQPHLPVIVTALEVGWRYRLEMPPRLAVTDPVTPATDGSKAQVGGLKLKW